MMMMMFTPGWLVICSWVGAASYVHQSLDWNVLDFGVRRYQREFYLNDNARGEIMWKTHLQTGEGSFGQLTSATKFAAHFSCSRLCAVFLNHTGWRCSFDKLFPLFFCLRFHLNPPRWQPLHLVGEHGPALGDGASKLSLVHVREHLGSGDIAQ